MCGIIGIVTRDPNIHGTLQHAEQVQRHRGPDSQARAVYSVGGWQIGFAHQRLAILDLSDAGHQPMQLPTGEDTIIYNGEVYNYTELRRELQTAGYHFHSDTDTEVVLTALRHWGIAKALQRFNGMWAFAWLDHKRGRLYFARDRVGIKPFYYFQSGDTLYFASEIKTILTMVQGKFGLNHKVIRDYVAQALLDASDETMFQGILHLTAGHYAYIDLTQPALDIEFRRYWELPVDEIEPASEEALLEHCRELFFDAVKLRLRSDVPVGVLLSGGVDSSAIACAMHSILGRHADLNLLSAVSQDGRFDESPFIQQVARALRRDVYQVSIDLSPQQAIEALETLSWINDEPIGGFSSVAHYRLMAAAKDLGITVVLSGQGADELLCGYKKYVGFYLQYLLRRHCYAEAIGMLHSFWKRKTILSQFSFQEAKRYLPSLLTRSDIDIRGPALMPYRPVAMGLDHTMTLQHRQAADIYHLSVPGLVHYEDRLSMAWSREIRLPFLDYRLMELLCPLAPQYKLHDGWTKFLFRKAMQRDMPKTVVWRKDKRGFINPGGEWLKHDLRPKVLDYFDKGSLIFNFGLINRQNLLKQYKMYCNQPEGKGNIWYQEIFSPLALEIWLRRFDNYLS